jgi:two-component system sensor histidine kinase CpxA
MASQLGNYVGGQKRFLGDIAHELCSPLSRIHLQIALLEGQVDVAPSQLRRLGEIQQEVEELSTLVNELLHFSQAAIGAKLDLTPVVVEDAVRAAVAKEAPADARVDVEIEPGLRALANDVVFTRSLGNLVRNSLRYAGASGPICVTARRVDRDVVVTVADSGPGVHADVIERIFEPFYRPEESRSRSTGGAGLGLAIVKSGIEACNGTVTCRNRQPNGLEVSLRLPTA